MWIDQPVTAWSLFDDGKETGGEHLTDVSAKSASAALGRP
jgi:hypothetical protein